jgi:ABC-type uncharacterized transport system substrate-binding protein
MVQLNNVMDVEETEAGIVDGFKEAGLVERHNHELRKQNTQGDMSTLKAIVDVVVGSGADLVITFSTPTLRLAIQRTPKVPIVFTYVADGITAGAGRSASDHLPNVNGARRFGAMFVPAEVNSVFFKDQFEAVARAAGVEPVSAPENAAFASIAQAANRAEIPVFAFQTVQAHHGAAVVLARDYKDAGRLMARMTARTNPAAASSPGLRIGADVLKSADEVIR